MVLTIEVSGYCAMNKMWSENGCFSKQRSDCFCGFLLAQWCQHLLTSFSADSCVMWYHTKWRFQFLWGTLYVHDVTRRNNDYFWYMYFTYISSCFSHMSSNTVSYNCRPKSTAHKHTHPHTHTCTDTLCFYIFKPKPRKWKKKKTHNIHTDTTHALVTLALLWVETSLQGKGVWLSWGCAHRRAGTVTVLS